MQENILHHEKISKLFLTFCIPAILSMVIAGMQTMIDGIFVGNILGPNAMASINIAAPFTQLILGVSMIVSIGTQSYMGLRIGEGHVRKAQNAFKTFIICITLVGILITVLGLGFPEQIAILLGASNSLKESVCLYIQTISIFTIPMAMMFLFGFSNRLIGHPGLYFKGMMLSLVCNLILNYVLIAKLGLGVTGAAIATGLSYSSALLVVARPMLNKANMINVYKGTFDPSTLIPVLYNGSSEGIVSLSSALSAYLFNMAFMSIAGEQGVAAFTAINYVGQFGIYILFGISDGIGPIISYNYGKMAYDRVNQAVKLAYQVGLAIGTLVFMLLFFFGESLVELFLKTDQSIIDLAVQGSKVYAIAFFMNGFNIINSGYFTFIGEAMKSVMIAAGRGLLFILIGMMILPNLLGVHGIWMTIPFAEALTVLLGIGLLIKSSKKSLNTEG